MKKTILFLAPVLVLLIAVGAVGCGSEAETTPTPTQAGTPTPSPTPTPTASPAPTPTPAPTPSPDASGPPCRFRGTAQLDGADVPDGTIIKATVAGHEFTTTTPAAGYGPSSYVLTIPRPEGVAFDGETVTFTIGGHCAEQTATWSTGGNLVVNLTGSST
ncbi:MAG: hypothetical protein IBX68_02670 [Dehalococcoidia bacterium]|nr:hypothetical protein [Dehalococcoidia bacterium]